MYNRLHCIILIGGFEKRHMEKECLISIRGFPDFAGNEPVELTTAGSYSYSDKGLCIVRYADVDPDGQSSEETCVTIDRDSVTVEHHGLDFFTLIFRRGRLHYMLTEENGQPVTMTITTNMLRHTFNNAGGQLDVDYSILVNQTQSTRNRLHMDVRDRTLMN